MKAQDLPFTQLLQGAKQFIIPIFQRQYSWEICHCEQLWRDILRIGESSEQDSHFIGSIVYIPENDTSAAISRWLVIDGQQRITTIILLLITLMKRLRDVEAKGVDGSGALVSAAEIEDYYLRNRHGKGELSYKTLLTKTDKDALILLLDGKEPPELLEQSEFFSIRICENYHFFKEKMQDADLNIVYEGIQKLMIVDVRLQHGIDNPQMIFESMNSTGKALTQADLIRNFVLMNQPHEEQTRLYNEYWAPIEADFGVEGYIKQFDEFIRYFLVMQTGRYRIKRDEVYQEFKSFSLKYDIKELLALLKEFSEYYCCIALGKEKDPDLSIAFQDIRELRADVCYPLLMEYYDDYRDDLINKNEFIKALLLVESYVFRRAVCEIPTNSLVQTFATFGNKLKKDRYMESMYGTFLSLSSYRRFPKDDEFKRRLKVRNLYSFNRRSYWLRRFENYGRKERVQVQDYTIEHIMPQNENLSGIWKEELGEDWAKIHEEYLHTLGNLTLTGYNSEYSDRPFVEKRDMEGGFRYSPLLLNKRLRECNVWNESAIKERADRLSEKAILIWEGPMLSEDILEAYLTTDKKDKTGSKYSINDHQNLSGGHTRELFDEFRKSVMTLDECVREEFLKMYVAYKAETNFVDIVPQAKRLKLIFNIDFPDINDSRGICRDVTGVNKWGNGNVEIYLETLDDIPYAIGLARQALERQLGVEEMKDEY